jgi:hypothetical protein
VEAWADETMSEDTKGPPVEPSLIGINQEAPVVGASEIEIAAAPETVWDVLTAMPQDGPQGVSGPTRRPARVPRNAGCSRY